MNRQKIVEILEIYRPGQGLESDPEVRGALDAAAQDPELGMIRDQIDEFDAVFRDALNQVEVPADLQEKILQANRLGQSTRASVQPAGKSNLLQWLHPASLGFAAAIIIMLALSFTYWNRPTIDNPGIAFAQDPISSAAHSLYTSLNPSFKSRDGGEIKAFLQNRNGFAPASLPGDVVWDKAFACDVIEHDGRKVSIICFMAPDNSRSMHLFTFPREEFPDANVSRTPTIHRSGKTCCAQWADDEKVHVLYSDKGEENLRAILDI